MNKNDLVSKIAEVTKLNKTQVTQVLESTIDITKKAVKKGEPVRLIGFGTFARVKRNSRKAKNPRTGESIHVKAHWTPRFKAGKEFKSLVR